MKINIILKAILFFTLVGCGINEENKVKTFYVETNKLQSSNEIDFKLIKEWVRDKKLVFSIGESTHGLGEFYSMKSEVIKFLHKDLGYEVLAIEGGLADINLAWIDVNNLDFLELRNKTLFGNFRCKEIEPLFRYIKEKSNSKTPLLYTGFDTQVSGDYYENYLDSICTHLKLKIDVKEEFSAYNKIYRASFEADSTNFIKYRDSYQNTLTRIKDEITKNKDSLMDIMTLSDLEIRIILRSLELQFKAVDYSYSEKMNSENMHQGIVIRDKLMAENIKWIIETLYPNKKIIIWAHNGHVGKSGINNFSTKMMGEHLKDIYKDNYFSIGLFAFKGNTYQHWTKKSIEFENSDSISIEYKMKRDNYKFTYQKFGNKNINDWTNNEVTAFEIENNGNVTFVPSNRFDAAINIYSGDIPTFEDN